jgi:hypothetical protein
VEAGTAGAAELRRELCARNVAFAQEYELVHVLGYGNMPVIVYAPEGNRHGNFFASSYRAILKRPYWACRLDKVHAQGRRALPEQTVPGENSIPA